MELALWTHDLVYDTRRQDNEAASAERACQWLADAGLAAHAEALREMILATRHQQPSTDSDAALVVDIDLSILGSTAQVYAGYEEAVRQEYAWVPEPLFPSPDLPILWRHRQWNTRKKDRYLESEARYLP